MAVLVHRPAYFVCGLEIGRDEHIIHVVLVHPNTLVLDPDLDFSFFIAALQVNH
jgi:hypothetical protein